MTRWVILGKHYPFVLLTLRLCLPGGGGCHSHTPAAEGKEGDP